MHHGSGARDPRVHLSAGLAVATLLATAMTFAPSNPASIAAAVVEYEPACSAGAVYDRPYVVPPNVHRITVEAFGARGEDGAGAASHGGGMGGPGAHVTVEHVAVTPGQKIYWGNVEGGWGSGVHRPNDRRAGRGGNGVWVAFGQPDLNCRSPVSS